MSAAAVMLFYNFICVQVLTKYLLSVEQVKYTKKFHNFNHQYFKVNSYYNIYNFYYNFHI